MKVTWLTFLRVFVTPFADLPNLEARRLARFTTLFLLISIGAVLFEKLIAGNIPNITLVILGIAYIVARTVWYRLAGVMLVLALSLPSFLVILTLATPNATQVMSASSWLVLPLVISSLLFSVRDTAITGIALVLLLLILPCVHQTLTPPMVAGAVGFVTTITILFFVVMSQRNRMESDRQAQLQRNQLVLQKEMQERQRIEAQLRMSEARYRVLSSISADYVFSTVIDDQGHSYLNWVAGAFEAITGYSREEYIATGGWAGHLHPADREHDQRDMQALSKNQRVVTEVRTITKDQQIRWVRVYAHPSWDEQHARLIGVMGAVQDITSQKQAEADREALIVELEHKNAELERFTYTVSHDLKSPLITIGGFIGFLEQDARTGNLERLQHDITRIRDATHKMHMLLDDLLRLSRIGRITNPPETVPFLTLVHEAIALVDGQLQQRGATVTMDDDLPLVVVDRIRMVEVLQNLLENAIKFMGSQPQPHIHLGVRKQGNDVVFTVADNGIGIDPRYHQRVFGLFERIDHASPGTGIGLALVKRIIEVHGGRIWIESEGDGKGTTICFTL